MLVIDKSYPYLSKDNGKYILSSLFSTDSVTINLDDEVEIGDVYVAGDFISVGNVTVIGSSFQANKIDITADATFKPTVNCGVLMVNGSAIFEKSVNCTEFMIQGKTSIKDTLSCRGDATLHSSIIVIGTATVCGRLKVDGSMWIGRSLDARSGISISGPLKMYGEETTTYGRVSLGDTVLIATDNHIFGFNFKAKMQAPATVEDFMCEENRDVFSAGNMADLKSMATVALMSRRNIEKK